MSSWVQIPNPKMPVTTMKEILILTQLYFEQEVWCSTNVRIMYTNNCGLYIIQHSSLNTICLIPKHKKMLNTLQTTSQWKWNLFYHKSHSTTCIAHKFYIWLALFPTWFRRKFLLTESCFSHFLWRCFTTLLTKESTEDRQYSSL